VNPLTDELSEAEKQRLAAMFAMLRGLFRDFDVEHQRGLNRVWHLQWEPR
jgi:hypothetical protein